MSIGENIRHAGPFRRLVIPVCVALAGSCADLGDSRTPDAALYRLITVTDPFGAWRDFPGADSVAAGTLNGSAAHRPLVHVRINGVAASALAADTLPAGGRFPEGSTIVKSVLMDNRTILLAVMHKDSRNPLAGNGWLWAEFEPDGAVFLSVALRGAHCTGCHARERGGLNDLVRTFERQR